MELGPFADGIDHTKPEGLRRQGGAALLVAMCESFLESTPQRLLELTVSTDPVAVSRICHAFKTSSRLIGAIRLGELCETLEYATEDGSAIPPGAVESVREECARAQHWVEDVLREAVGVPSPEDEPSGVVQEVARLEQPARSAYLPSVLLVLIMVATSLALWSALTTAERSALRAETIVTGERIRDDLKARLEADTGAFVRMARRWEREGGPSRPLRTADAGSYVASVGHMQAVGWVDATCHVRWIAPLEGNAAAVGLDLRGEDRRRRAIDRAMKERTVAASEVIDLVQGGRGMLVICPLFDDDTLDGFVVGVYRLRELMDHIILQGSPDYSLRVAEDSEPFYERGAAVGGGAPNTWLHDTSLEIHGALWEIDVWPGVAAIDRHLTALPIVVLLSGCLAAVLSAIILHLGRTAARKAKLYESANQQLLEALQARAATEAHALGTQQLENIGLLAGGIAHDFNNLLSGILGNAELARDALPAMSPARKPMGKIATIAERAADLCQQLLASAGHGVFTMQPVDLGQIIREMSQLLELAGSKKIRLVREISEGAHIVEGDAGQLRQIVMNLVINASEAMESEDGRTVIRVGRARPSHAVLSTFALGGDLPEGEFVVLEVADTGPGMDEETRSRIFDPFYSTKVPGRGLGMAAVYGIVRRHRGAVRVLSTPGRGTTVRVLLPASRLPLPHVEGPGAHEVSHTDGTGETILIVDDEADIRMVMRAMLEDAGFRVLSASDGQEALEVFAQESPDIRAVVLDLTMPRLDGASTLAALRSTHPELPVVVCSGYGSTAIDEQVGRDSVTRFLEKPFRMHDLLAALRSVLRESGSRRE